MKKLQKSHFVLLLSSFIFTQGNQALAVPIGVIDSGVDFTHEELVAHTWKNPKETDGNKIDDDKNGYIDDINGWNFAEKNKIVFDSSLLGSFSSEVKKFFEIQLKVLNGTATDEDKQWMAEKKKDQKFLEELNRFGNFVHGTHVAGIASHDADAALIMAAKIIPTEVKSPISLNFIQFRLSLMPFISFPTTSLFDDYIINTALSLIVSQQIQLLSEVGKYLDSTSMQVANCSFGTGMEQAAKVVELLGKMILKRDLSKEEIAKYSEAFMKQMMKQGAIFTESSKKTLFVMAAGNDGANNDEVDTYPANLKYDNTLSVAATKGIDKLASFSNFGKNKVEVAAPGVGIISTIPGNEKLALSGTSQAAPYVVNVAGRIMDMNSKLTPSQVKQILIETVDLKSFLKDKVLSGGIVNETRAIHAAKLSLGQPLANAIAMAKKEVADLKQGFFSPTPSFYAFDGTADYEGLALPLPSPLLVK